MIDKRRDSDAHFRLDSTPCGPSSRLLLFSIPDTAQQPARFADARHRRIRRGLLLVAPIPAAFAAPPLSIFAPRISRPTTSPIAPLRSDAIFDFASL